ncbi:hypothetical protein V6N12_050928 [Hibiscus sabdariffa]|uniref:Fe2OG dioxygenase domain-containing protein n=1 Tax=Hibiscus sabdariffa TaxID=183260 RepID=A0ABR2GFL7_9ROSI
MDPEPPLHETYKPLFASTKTDHRSLVTVEEGELPLVDLRRLSQKEAEKEKCKEEIGRAAHEWGFFQVMNHGISMELLEKLREEQVRLFKQPFQNKSLNFSAGSYRWGTPTATSLGQLSWSEAFHIPMTDISSSSMEAFATKVASLAKQLAEILAEKLGQNWSYFQSSCLPSTCYLRLNRYPPCSIPYDVYGLMPHTDSDFLTILHQDEVGGLQLVKDGKWISVKPNHQALIINIGDLFQAWSNDFYTSVEHCVVTHPTQERFSAAYFLCPSYETVIESCSKPSVYTKFSFREYRQKVQEDVQRYGYKVGLPSFIACQSVTYNDHACLGPGNETATAGYISNLTLLLDSMSSKASDKSFYNDSLNGIYSLFLCRGDVSGDVCRVCVNNATQTLTQMCPSDKGAVIWYDQCLLQYSDINFFGQPQFYPMLLMWNTQNSTSPEEGNIGTLGLFYSLVAQAPYEENMFGTNEMVVGNGPGRRYGLVQCSRDLDVSSCSSCLGELLNQTEECCIGRRGWRILTPSCFIRYEMYSFYEQTLSDPPRSPDLPQVNQGAGKGRKSTTKTIVIVVSSIAGVFASVLVAGFWYYSSSVKKRKQTGF